jgi:hypothetical protein
MAEFRKHWLTRSNVKNEEQTMCRRCHAVLLICTSLLGILTLSQPRNSIKKAAPLYFPTRLGTQWDYVELGSGREESYRVTDVNEAGEMMILTISRILQGGKVIPHEKIAVTRTDIYRNPLAPSDAYCSVSAQVAHGLS